MKKEIVICDLCNKEFKYNIHNNDPGSDYEGVHDREYLEELIVYTNTDENYKRGVLLKVSFYNVNKSIKNNKIISINAPTKNYPADLCIDCIKNHFLKLQLGYV